MAGMIEFKPLTKTPDEALHHSHYFCDYIELLALTDVDDGIRTSDIYDRFYEDNRIEGIGSIDSSKNVEEWNSKINNWLDQIRCRESHYGEYYPFTVDENKLSIKLNLTIDHNLYIFFLLCSSFSYIKNYNSLSTVFEKLSCLVMKRYLPNFAEVYTFGVSTTKNERYNGSLEQKFTRLAVDLKLTLSNKDNIFNRRDNGDGGIDIVAWVPFLDDMNLDRKQIFVGQSACGKNWMNKQASVDRVKNYLIDLPNNCQNVLFIPYDIRDFERNFDHSGELTASIVFDRYRMLKLIDYSNIESDHHLQSLFNSIMQSALEYKEDII